MKAERAHPTVPYKTRAGHRALMSARPRMTLDEVESRAEDAGEQYVFDESWDEVQ